MKHYCRLVKVALLLLFFSNVSGFLPSLRSSWEGRSSLPRLLPLPMKIPIQRRPCSLILISSQSSNVTVLSSNETSTQEIKSNNHRTPITARRMPSLAQHHLHDWTSSVQHLRIEDTDAYGIMYNGNYLKHYARAMEHIMLTSNKKWYGCIIGFDTMRFKGSPRLGEAFVIHATKAREEDDSAQTSIWNMSLTTPDGGQGFNTVQGLTVWSPAAPFDCNNANDDYGDSLVMQSIVEPTGSTTKHHRHEYTTYKDEFDYDGFLPLTTILNYFERPRSASLGDASGLQRLQAEDNILVVVTRIDSLRWNRNTVVVPGDIVTIDSYATLRRRATMVEYIQVASIHRRGKQWLASGKVTLMLVDRESKRPKTIPEWAKKQVMSCQ